jgi:hypothetical protein
MLRCGESLFMAPTGDSRQCGKMSAIEVIVLQSLFALLITKNSGL